MRLWMTSADAPIYRYRPAGWMAGALLAVAVIAAVEAYLTDAATGRLLLVVAAVVLAAIAAVDLIFSPRLTATPAGIAVFTPTVRTRLRWDEVDVLRVDEHTHRGIAARTLEIESGERLIVLSKRSLGRDPRDVLTELDGLQPAG
jgi:apolipoprotein N-acyltransferase